MTSHIKGSSKTYDSVEDMFNDMAAEEKKYPWYKKLRLAIIRRSKRYNLWRFTPRGMYYTVLSIVQRARRGWADTDVYDLDHYLADVIAGTLRRLADTDHGWPQSDEYPTYESFVNDLRKMADAFELWNKLDDIETDEYWEPREKGGKLVCRFKSIEEQRAHWDACNKRREETLNEMRRIFDVWPSLWD